MNNRENSRYGYIIANSVNVRDKPDPSGKLLDVLHLGDPIQLKSKQVNGRYEIYYQSRTKTGWIPEKAVSFEKATDYARLAFVNRTGKKIPVASRYHGPKVRTLMPNERVEMIIRVGDWCKTSKGWSMFHWFEKDNEIYDDIGVQTVYVEAIRQLVKDYASCVKRLQRRQYLTDEGFVEEVIKLETLILCFLSEDIEQAYGHGVGERWWDWCNADLGIDRAWIKQKYYAKQAICREQGIKEKKRIDTARRHKKSGRSAQKR